MRIRSADRRALRTGAAARRLTCYLKHLVRHRAQRQRTRHTSDGWRDRLVVEEKLAELAAENGKLQAERDEYRKLYLRRLELCRKLERGFKAKARAVCRL